MSDFTREQVIEIHDITINIFNSITRAAKLFGLECKDLDDPDIESLSRHLNEKMLPTFERIINLGALGPDTNVKMIDVSHGIYCIKMIVDSMQKGNETEFDRWLGELSSLNLFPI